MKTKYITKKDILGLCIVILGFVYFNRSIIFR